MTQRPGSVSPSVREVAVLAGASGGLVLAGLSWTGTFGHLVALHAFAGGVAAALAVEAAFLADTALAERWRRRRWRVLFTGVLLGGLGVAAVVIGPLVLAMAAWGLATYFALLGLSLAVIWARTGHDESRGE